MLYHSLCLYISRLQRQTHHILTIAGASRTDQEAQWIPGRPRVSDSLGQW